MLRFLPICGGVRLAAANRKLRLKTKQTNRSTMDYCISGGMVHLLRIPANKILF